MVFFTWTQPLLNSIKDLDRQKAVLDESLSYFKEIEQIREDVLAKYNSISEDDLKRIAEFLPSQPKDMDLIMEINDIARNSGVLLKDINITSADQTTDKKINKINLTIKVSAPYKNFIGFLENLEKNLRLIEIDDLDFISGGVDSYEYNIKASSYWQSKNL